MGVKLDWIDKYVQISLELTQKRCSTMHRTKVYTQVGSWPDKLDRALSGLFFTAK